MLILVSQNYKNINFLNNVNKIIFDNSKIKIHKKVNGITYYKSNAKHGFCNDFKLPCIIYPKKIKVGNIEGKNVIFLGSIQVLAVSVPV